MLCRTWSGELKENAWHWNSITYRKLGDIVFWISKGDFESRKIAFYKFIELKGWFSEDEFEEYITKLDNSRIANRSKPLRKIITEIYKEISPTANWKNKNEVKYSDIMLYLRELISIEKQKLNGLVLSMEEQTEQEKQVDLFENLNQKNNNFSKPKEIVYQMSLELF